MLDLFNLPTPQGCNIQTFYGGATSGSTTNSKSWIKPRGVSNVYMLLIGSGGNGDGATTGGGSGAVTVWYGSALNVPDQLQITAGINSSSTVRRASPTNVVLLQANAASSSTAGAATTAGVFAASGFYQSIAGQAGSSSTITASSTTFLSGGASGATATANYGYVTADSGFFQMQPIIVGVGGAGGDGKGGIGCGGVVFQPAGVGGPGFVLIASW
jgi:hypothetical protein